MQETEFHGGVISWSVSSMFFSFWDSLGDKSLNDASGWRRDCKWGIMDGNIIFRAHRPSNAWTLVISTYTVDLH